MNIEYPIKNYIELKNKLKDKKYMLIEEGIENKGTVNEEFKYGIWLAPSGILKITAYSQNHIKIEFLNEIEFNCITRNAEIKKG